jgi:hypothetical protein
MTVEKISRTQTGVKVDPEKMSILITLLRSWGAIFITRKRKKVQRLADWYNSTFALFGHNLSAFSLGLAEGWTTMIG